MLKALRGTARFIDRKNGWSRLGLALSLTIIIIAVVVLYRILRHIDPDELLDAMEATDWHTLIIAGLFVVAGYLTLTFYDLFALRAMAGPTCPTASRRCRASPVTPWVTMSAPASSPAAQCAIASIRPGALASSTSPKSAS
jgi:hypothetical protein